MASAGAEAYAIMLYGSARTPSLAGLFVLLDGLREFDRRREVLLLRHEDDPPPSASLAKALRLFAPARVQPVPRLAQPQGWQTHWPQKNIGCLNVLGRFEWFCSFWIDWRIYLLKIRPDKRKT